MKKNVKIIQLGILFIASIFVAFFASRSLAKYQMNQHDHLIGTYVDFRMTHNGDGQTALMNQVENSDSSLYSYEGYITLSVVNTKDEKVSQRELEFDLRSPSVSELEDHKNVKDIWGTSFSFANANDKSELYDIEIVKENGESYSEDEKIDYNGEFYNNTHFEAAVKKETELTVKVKRLKKPKVEMIGVSYSEALLNVEDVTIVIQTSKPYITTSIFTIRVANSLVFINSSKSTYFGFDALNINIKTAKEYSFLHLSELKNSTLPAKVKIDFDQNTIFDLERFRLDFENQYGVISDEYVVGYKYDAGKSLTLYIPMGSSIDLHFYISESVWITASAYFKYDGENIYDYTTEIAGVQSELGITYIYKLGN